MFNFNVKNVEKNSNRDWLKKKDQAKGAQCYFVPFLTD
jgi:hypothetical protein